jgi:carboxylesterase type B
MNGAASRRVRRLGFLFGALLLALPQLSKNMTDYWANFAKTANPDGPGLLHWPRNNRGHEPTLVLDNQLSVTDRYHDAQCNFLDTVPEIFSKEESTP